MIIKDKKKHFVSAMLGMAVALVFTGINGVNAKAATHTHKWSAASCYAPQTCTAYGCGATQGSALGHNYTTVVSTKNPTCTAQGETVKQCTRCTHKKTFYWGAILGHDYRTKNTPATCTQYGETFEECARSGCNATQNRRRGAAPLGHDMDWTVRQTPSCSSGYKDGYCKRYGCHQYVREEIRDYGNHSYHDVQILEKPSCVKVGKKTVKCDNCPAQKTVDIPIDTSSSGHKYVNWTTTKAPTCKDAGIRTWTCSNGCNIPRTEEIKPTGVHKVTKLLKTLEPTCTVAGYKLMGCTTPGCTKRERIDIPATGKHKFPSGTSGEAMICTYSNCGVTYCSVVGNHKFPTEKSCVQTVACTRKGCYAKQSATGKHVWVAPTCTKDGYCKTCGTLSGEKKTGHNFPERNYCGVESHCQNYGCTVTQFFSEKHDLVTFENKYCHMEGKKEVFCRNSKCAYREETPLPIDPSKHDFTIKLDRKNNPTNTLVCQNCVCKVTMKIEGLKDLDPEQILKYLPKDIDEKVVFRIYLISHGVSEDIVNDALDITYRSNVTDILGGFKTATEPLAKSIEYTEYLEKALKDGEDSSLGLLNEWLEKASIAYELSRFRDAVKGKDELEIADSFMELSKVATSCTGLFSKYFDESISVVQNTLPPVYKAGERLIVQTDLLGYLANDSEAGLFNNLSLERLSNDIIYNEVIRCIRKGCTSESLVMKQYAEIVQFLCVKEIYEIEHNVKMDSSEFLQHHFWKEDITIK